MRNDRKHSRRFNVLYRMSILGLLSVATQIALTRATTSPKLSSISVPALAMNGKIASTSNRNGLKKQVNRESRVYSYLSATSGSILVARRAGM
ncbi:MAG TPA: hypothetical protein VF074_10480 [Pyrinomonadaceae bacterium]